MPTTPRKVATSKLLATLCTFILHNTSEYKRRFEALQKASEQIQSILEPVMNTGINDRQACPNEFYGLLRHHLSR